MKSSVMIALAMATAPMVMGTAVQAQNLAVTFDTYCPPDSEAACFGVAEVMGLDPNGDGFLAVRTGPGAGYPMIAKLRNGDRVGDYAVKGAWHGISFGAEDRLGWVHGKWLGNFVP